MQLMWLSGPTANVVTVSIGRKTILIGVLAVAVTLVALGGLLQFMGIRIAVDADPTWARALGGVTSTVEQERIEQQYEEQIARLKSRIDGLSRKVNELANAKKAIVDLIPANEKATGKGGQGGPLRRILDFEWFAPKAVDGLVQLNQESRVLDRRISALITTWETELDVVRGLPLAAPLSVDHHVSSEYGFRRDPINRGLARHTGMDYVAPYGSPVEATAAGRVIQAGVLGAYGLVVDLDHGDGFTTRYAHLSKIEVAPGDTVATGTVIGRLGNTGRSTGPHLHYEIRVHGRPINPVPDEVLDVARSQVHSRHLALAEEE
jgi:murein DD-endopeptidase MepM/ murein hydrolase activator NlpD